MAERVKINKALLKCTWGGAAKQKPLPCSMSLVAFTLGGGIAPAATDRASFCFIFPRDGVIAGKRKQKGQHFHGPVQLSNLHQTLHICSNFWCPMRMRKLPKAPNSAVTNILIGTISQGAEPGNGHPVSDCSNSYLPGRGDTMVWWKVVLPGRGSAIALRSC